MTQHLRKFEKVLDCIPDVTVIEHERVNIFSNNAKNVKAKLGVE